MEPRTTRQKVERLWDEGYTARWIAKQLDVSTQAVYQHLQNIRNGVPEATKPGPKPLKEPREKRPEEAAS